MEFFKSNSRVAFMGTRKIWYTMSAILFVTSLAALFTKGLNLGVDFTGGITVEAKFTSEARPEELRTGLARAGFEDVQVQNFGSSRDVAIRLPPPEGQSPDQIRSEIEGVLKTADPAVIVSRLEVVGPQVGAELRNSAAVALISTLILIFIYVFIRFHAWQLSAGAIIAAIHDPVIVLGFFALSGIVFDLSAVAALLAVIGYSLNDTVVILDRVRENRGKRAWISRETVNMSINQTFTRTIMTGGTTLVSVTVLIVMGGTGIRPFAYTFFIGLLVGTFSSVAIAAPLVYSRREEEAERAKASIAPVTAMPQAV